jgi:hypothetical protein
LASSPKTQAASRSDTELTLDEGDDFRALQPANPKTVNTRINNESLGQAARFVGIGPQIMTIFLLFNFTRRAHERLA